MKSGIDKIPKNTNIRRPKIKRTMIEAIRKWIKDSQDSSPSDTDSDSEADADVEIYSQPYTYLPSFCPLSLPVTESLSINESKIGDKPIKKLKLD